MMGIKITNCMLTSNMQNYLSNKVPLKISMLKKSLFLSPVKFFYKHFLYKEFFHFLSLRKL